MYKLLGSDYNFVATEPMEEERIQLGWGLRKEYPYEIRSYENQDTYKKCLNLGLESDVVIIGSAPEVFVSDRIRQNELTFRYSERLFKTGIWRLMNPRTLISMIKQHTCHRNSNLHMLCASAYTSKDVSVIKAYPNKKYKWGYFPELRKYNHAELLANKNKQPISLLWCGRFLGWKHPEKAVAVMNRLRDNGFGCMLEFIGDGPINAEIRNLVTSLKLDDRIKFLGSMSPEKVRQHMEKADIFLFTSDRQEGWGVVLNEAMNSGCAVVASHAIGSVPFLIQTGNNGFIYKDNDIDDLYHKVEILVEDADLRAEMGLNAVKTVERLWNPKVAAERLVEFCNGLLANKVTEFEDGPCSRAKVLKNNWFPRNE